MVPSLVLALSLAAPALAQYGGQDFDTIECSDVTISIDGGDNYLHPCAAIAEIYAGAGVHGAGIGMCTTPSCDPGPTDVGVLYPVEMGFVQSSNGASTPLYYVDGYSESSDCSSEGCYGAQSACYIAGTSNGVCTGLFAGHQVMAANAGGSANKMDFYFDWGQESAKACVVGRRVERKDGARSTRVEGRTREFVSFENEPISALDVRRSRVTAIVEARSAGRPAKY